MQVPNTPENMEFILNSFNCNEIMISVCRTNPNLAATVIEEYIANSSSGVSDSKKPYMRIFDDVKKYVRAIESGNNPSKIPMIKDLRHHYGLDLATAKKTIDMWIEIYSQHPSYNPRSFYDLSGKCIRIPTSIV